MDAHRTARGARTEALREARKRALERFGEGPYTVMLTGARRRASLQAERNLTEVLSRLLALDRKEARSLVERAVHLDEPQVLLSEVSDRAAIEVKRTIEEAGGGARVIGALAATAAGVPSERRSITEAVRAEVWRRDQGRCVDCGSRQRLELDHIVPLSKGGSNTVRNIELRCEACNRKKGARI